MRSLQDISNSFHVAHSNQEARDNAIKAQAEKMKKAALRYQRLAAQKMGEMNRLYTKLNSERGVYWTDDLLRPMLEEIEERTGWEFDNKNELHTFGLRAECPVHIWDGTKDEHGFRNYKAYITFTTRIHHDDDEWSFELYYDTGEKTDGAYPRNSIGALNGFDKKTAKVESIEQIIDILQKQIDEAA